MLTGKLWITAMDESWGASSACCPVLMMVDLSELSMASVDLSELSRLELRVVNDFSPNNIM